MAEHRKQFNAAAERWQQLHTEQEYSLAPAIGTTAILYTQEVSDSRYSNVDDTEVVKRIYAREAKAYKKEAEELAKRLDQNGLRSIIVTKPTREDFDNIAKDKTISSVITIGSGSLQSLILDMDKSWRNSLTWRDASFFADHLKQGVFIQRQCGHFREGEAPVPLGALMMTSFANVHAVTGSYFTPESLEDPQNDNLQPFTDQDFLTYDELKGIRSLFQAPKD